MTTLPLPNYKDVFPDDILARIRDLESLANLTLVTSTDDVEEVEVEGGTIVSYDPTTGIASVILDDGETVNVTIIFTQLPFYFQAQSAAATISYATARVHELMLLGTPVVITLTGTDDRVACRLELYLLQDATGSRLVTWPGSVKWPSATAPTLSTTANAVDLVALETFDNGTTWYATLVGKAYA